MQSRESKTAFDITAGASGAFVTRSPASTIDLVSRFGLRGECAQHARIV
jgi:hypothetical protein